jgi:hypothetical protein
MKDKILGYLVEEFDNNNKLVWSAFMSSKPTSLEIEKDIKHKLHNWVITPLVADTKNIIKVSNIKKYDSKKLTEAYGGL